MELETVAGPETIFMAPLVANKVVNLGTGFHFYIYKCKTCSYLELHDAPV